MKTFFITGSTSGIGAAIAKRAVQEGHRVVLHGRDMASLEQLKKELGATHVAAAIQADLAQKNIGQSIFSSLQEKGIEVDVLVNNAGFGVYGDFSATDWEDESNMLQVNVVALTELTKAALAHMRERGAGQIVNVASTAAFYHGPNMAVYFASKAYVLSFTESIRIELEGSPILVSTLAPGPVQTGFQGRSKTTDLAFMQKNHSHEPEEIADYMFKKVIGNSGVFVPGFRNKFLYTVSQLVPKKVTQKMTKKVMGKKK